MPQIFISYRRADSTTITGRIYDRLVGAFGENNVFKDVDDIPLGEDFRSVLEREVNRSDILLVIIGSRWLSIANENGERRLDDPLDFVRIEVESSLKNSSILVMPVLVGGAALPAGDQLPESLRNLVYHNAATVRDDPDFSRDINRLIQQIKTRFETKAPTAPIPPPAPSTTPLPPLPNCRWLPVVLVAIAIIIVGGIWLASRNSQGLPSTATPTEIVKVPSATYTSSLPLPTETPTPTNTPKPTATPTPTPTPTITPSPTPLPPEGVANLHYAMRNLNSYYPTSINLMPSRPFAGLIEPQYKGTTQLFGSLKLGVYQEVAIVFDRTEVDAGQLYIDQNLNQNLTDDIPMRLRGNGSTTSALPILLTYNGQQQTYNLIFYYSASENERDNVFRLLYYPGSYRQGEMRFGNKLYQLVLDDHNVDGRFDTIANYFGSDALIFDIDRDGVFSNVAPDLYTSLVAAIEIDGTCYQVASVEASGTSLTLQKVARGIVSGKVTDQVTGATIGDAKVILDATSATTDSSGQYKLSVCPGDYHLIRITHKGFVPREIGLSELQQNFTVRPDETFPLDVALQPAPESPSGEVVLKNGDSYHFLNGQRGQYTGGDFYLGVDNNEAWFWANNDQRGVLSLGNIGDGDLNAVSFCDKRDSDYTPFGVQAVEGFTYVALPHQGEEGSFVVFRVKAVNADSVFLDFVYRDSC